jgi:hypothetical protein
MKGFVFFTSIGFLIGLWLFRVEMKQFDPHKLTQKYDQKTIEYFREITLRNEFNSKVKKRPVRYKKDLKIYLSGTYEKYMVDEVEDILIDLNAIINPIQLTLVKNKSDANMIIFFGDYNSFVTNNPDLIDAPKLKDCDGYFKLKSRGDEIKSSRIFINLENQDSQLDLLDCLREELSQSLGAVNDSWKYKNSVFYQGPNYVTKYSEIDVNVIKMLYNEGA